MGFTRKLSAALGSFALLSAFLGPVSASLVCPANPSSKCPSCCAQVYASKAGGATPSYRCSACPPNAPCGNPCPSSPAECEQLCASKNAKNYFYSLLAYDTPSSCSCYNTTCNPARGLDNGATGYAGAFGLAGTIASCQTQPPIPSTCKVKDVVLKGTSIAEKRGSDASFNADSCVKFCKSKGAKFYDFVQDATEFEPRFTPFRCQCSLAPEATADPADADAFCFETCPPNQSSELFPTIECPSTITGFSKCCECRPICEAGQPCPQYIAICPPQQQCVPFWNPATSVAFAGNISAC